MIPMLLPIHQFLAFKTSDIRDRILCKVYADPEECLKLDVRRCEVKGILTESYEVCMISLNQRLSNNATQFCEQHYQRDIWLDGMSPRYLQFYLRKHNCYSMSGKPRGREYCLDYRDHDDSWGQQDLFECYQKYNVEFGKEFCDSKFATGVELMRCYSEKQVPRGEEFCLSNFEAPEDLITCYEDIPFYNKNYCDLKHPDRVAKLECYREKAGLVLDGPFCDNRYDSLDDRYECYVDIGLMESKNREYCELANSKNISAKYECIDDLNFNTAYEACLKDKQDMTKKIRIDLCRKEAAVATNFLKGGEFCRFEFPYDLTLRYKCLEDEGVPREFLSSQCLGDTECLSQFGITYYPNECAKYLLMPRNQTYVVETLQEDMIQGFTVSKNLKSGQIDIQYREMGDDFDLISQKELPFIGTQNAFETYQLWILDADYEEFLLKVMGIDVPVSFGHFLLKGETISELQDLKDFQYQTSLEREKFLNPLLEDEEISIQEVQEVADVKTEQARRVAEELVSVFGQLQQTEVVGGVLSQLDQLFAELEMPQKDSLLFDLIQELRQTESLWQLREMPVGGKIRNEFLSFVQGFEFNQNMTQEVAIPLGFDLAFASPTFAILFDNYDSLDERPHSGKLVDEVFSQVRGQPFQQLIEDIKGTPSVSEIINDFQSEVFPDSLQRISEELRITQLYKKAEEIFQIRYNKQYLTAEAFKELLAALQNTTIASKLISEYGSQDTEIFDKILDELAYAKNSDVKFFQQKDLLIQQETMGQVVTEILEVLESPALNLSSKMISPVDLSKIVSPYQDSDMLASMLSLLSLETTERLYSGNQITEDTPLVSIKEGLQTRKSIGYLYKEYRDALSSAGRRLQNQEWQIGTWSFLSNNLIKAEVGGKEFQVSLESKNKVNVDGQSYRINDDWITYSQRGLLSVQKALELDDLQCHFAGDFESQPWWRIDFVESRRVKSVQIFNFQNGANPSNLEGASIYVGETLCARIGDTLPVNQYLIMECQDVDAPPPNRLDGVQRVFTGIEGKYLKIQSSQPGVLVVCNPQIETNVVDLKLELEISTAIAQCQGWQQECISNFTGIFNSENKYNCLAQYGVPITQQYCLEQLSSHHPSYHYPLRNKYECMTRAEISEEAGQCLGLYYDYTVENCLRDFESRFVVGFKGEQPKIDDPRGYLSNYYKAYDVLEEIQPKVQTVDSVSQIIDILANTDSEIELDMNREINIPEFLCDNVDVNFLTNPSESEMEFQMACHSFELGDNSYLQFRFNDEVSGKDDFIISRNDSSYQKFQINFGQDLELMKVQESFMFLRHQNMLHDEVESPIIRSNEDYNLFVSEPASEKLYESEPYSIGQNRSQTTNLVSVPMRNNSIGVATDYRLWKYPIFFENHDHEYINISPENNARLELPGLDSFQSEVNLKFDFFKKEFKYEFHGLKNMFKQLGGSGGLADEALTHFGALFLIAWMVQFCMYLIMKHQSDHLNFIKQNLHRYREIANAEDSQKIDDILGDSQHEGGESTLKEENDIYEIDQKYGPLVKEQLFEDFKYQRAILGSLGRLGILDTARGMKKRNSFLGFLMTFNTQKDSNAKFEFLKERSVEVCHQMTLLQKMCLQVARDKLDSVIQQQEGIQALRAIRKSLDEKNELRKLLPPFSTDKIVITLNPIEESPDLGTLDVQMVPLFDASVVHCFSLRDVVELQMNYFALCKEKTSVLPSCGDSDMVPEIVNELEEKQERAKFINGMRIRSTAMDKLPKTYVRKEYQHLEKYTKKQYYEQKVIEAESAEQTLKLSDSYLQADQLWDIPNLQINKQDDIFENLSETFQPPKYGQKKIVNQDQVFGRKRMRSVYKENKRIIQDYSLNPIILRARRNSIEPTPSGRLVYASAKDERAKFMKSLKRGLTDIKGEVKKLRTPQYGWDK